MINSLNSHLTHRNSPGHGTLLTLLSLCLPLPLSLSNIKFITQCLNRCINITNGLLRAWNYLWAMNLSLIDCLWGIHHTADDVVHALLTDWLIVPRNGRKTKIRDELFYSRFHLTTNVFVLIIRQLTYKIRPHPKKLTTKRWIPIVSPKWLCL